VTLWHTGDIGNYSLTNTIVWKENNG
jgi:hypothetical protein